MSYQLIRAPRELQVCCGAGFLSPWCPRGRMEGEKRELAGRLSGNYRSTTTLGVWGKDSKADDEWTTSDHDEWSVCVYAFEHECYHGHRSIALRETNTTRPVASETVRALKSNSQWGNREDRMSFGNSASFGSSLDGAEILIDQILIGLPIC